jgi:hypothetical protein
MAMDLYDEHGSCMESGRPLNSGVQINGSAGDAHVYAKSKIANCSHLLWCSHRKPSRWWVATVGQSDNRPIRVRKRQWNWMFVHEKIVGPRCRVDIFFSAWLCHNSCFCRFTKLQVASGGTPKVAGRVYRLERCFCRGWRGSFKIVKKNMVIDHKGAVLAKREGRMAKKHHNFPSHGWTHIQQQWLYDHQHPNLKNESEYGPNQRGVDPVVWQKRPCRGSITKKTWNLLTVGHSDSTWISSPSYWVPLIWFFKMNWHALC